MSSILCKVLIFREFASDGESARKYSLVFRGRTENSDEKTQDGENLKVHHIAFPFSCGKQLSVADRRVYCFLPMPIMSFTTSPPIIIPAAAGTKALLAGTGRLDVVVLSSGISESVAFSGCSSL